MVNRALDGAARPLYVPALPISSTPTETLIPMRHAIEMPQPMFAYKSPSITQVRSSKPLMMVAPEDWQWKSLIRGAHECIPWPGARLVHPGDTGRSQPESVSVTKGA